MVENQDRLDLWIRKRTIGMSSETVLYTISNSNVKIVNQRRSITRGQDLALNWGGRC